MVACATVHLSCAKTGPPTSRWLKLPSTTATAGAPQHHKNWFLIQHIIDKLSLVESHSSVVAKRGSDSRCLVPPGSWTKQRTTAPWCGLELSQLSETEAVWCVPKASAAEQYGDTPCLPIPQPHSATALGSWRGVPYSSKCLDSGRHSTTSSSSSAMVATSSPDVKPSNSSCCCRCYTAVGQCSVLQQGPGSHKVTGKLPTARANRPLLQLGVRASRCSKPPVWTRQHATVRSICSSNSPTTFTAAAAQQLPNSIPVPTSSAADATAGRQPCGAVWRASAVGPAGRADT